MNIRNIIGNTLSKLYIRLEESAVIMVVQKAFDYFTKVSAKFTGNVDFTDATVTGIGAEYYYFKALIEQTGVNDPTFVVVFENTFPSPSQFSLTYSDVGSYVLTNDIYNFSEASVTASIIIQHPLGTYPENAATIRLDDNARIHSFNSSLNLANGILKPALVEIKYYPSLAS
jgi:hypothetical protein